ncbi:MULTISPECIES: TraV family lipoprotein [Caballeronia]|uniref:TraV family lipoprotein n=1 Tax=Caballeronia TaxID=1827195 RepID=UPI000AE35A2F|nr:MULTISPECIES: TraV family lipoprotein [Caballeronia]MCE4548003.1 TraV family lipoprotein [Caballeronia sp. PC1]MCE4575706.1 TraV family lipoprotein [Caballeronia sp. CLC5]
MSNLKSKLAVIAISVCAVPVLSGCPAAFNPIGSNSYDCNRKQDPSSIYCHSFKAVEASTNGELPPSRFDSELNFSQYDKATDIAPVGQRNTAASPIRSGSGEPVVMGSGGPAVQGSATPGTVRTVAVDGMPDGMPVREGPVIQRTWIKHFVDGNDMLTSDTTVYKEIVGSHWSGFDGGNPAGAARGVYPHKPADSKALEAAKPSQPDTSQRTDFIQPGPQASAGESSPGNSLPSSMPQ